MSLPVTSELPIRLSWTRQITARWAVSVARLLVLLPPRRLRQVLEIVRLGTRRATAADALNARHAVVTVSARCAGQGCLQRSVAVILLCRLRGRYPDWCTGFRTRPFRAHAWVEVDGVAVGEPGDPADMALYRTVVSVRHRAGTRS